MQCEWSPGLTTGGFVVERREQMEWVWKKKEQKTMEYKVIFIVLLLDAIKQLH